MKRKNPFIKDTSNMSLDELSKELNHLTGLAAYAKAVMPTPRPTREKKFLYFIRCADTVKIGVSNCPWQRRNQLQTAAPSKLVLMSQIEKASDREKECHERLAHLRLHGEWFHLTDEVYDLIKELKDE